MKIKNVEVGVRVVAVTDAMRMVLRTGLQSTN